MVWREFLKSIRNKQAGPTEIERQNLSEVASLPRNNPVRTGLILLRREKDLAQ